MCGLKSNSTNFVFPHLILCYLSVCLFSLSAPLFSSPPYLSSNFMVSLRTLPIPIHACLLSSFMFRVSEATPPHCHGHAHRCADVCMCVYRRSRQLTAGLKQKEYNLLREEESKEMREVYNDRGREEGRKGGR